MKRIISICLSICLVFNTLSLIGNNVVYAKEKNQIKQQFKSYAGEKKLYIKKANNGKWNKCSSNSKAKIQITEKNSSIGIFKTNDGRYYKEVEPNSFIQVKKNQKKLSSFKAYKEMEKTNIPNEVLQGIASMAALAEENECEKAKVVYYTAYSSRNNALNNKGIKQNIVSASKKTWDGKTFYDYCIYFTNLQTKWKTIAESGETTKATLSAIKTLATGVVGTVSSGFASLCSIYEGGVSCLKAWKTATGKTPVYCDTSNSVMADIQYDIYLKYTYFLDGKTKRLGCSSQMVFVKKIETATYLYSSKGGKKINRDIKPNKPYYTPNYKSPYKKAFQHYVSPWVESSVGKVYNKKVVFSFPAFTWPKEWPKM